jgi:hypothetical protein
MRAERSARAVAGLLREQCTVVDGAATKGTFAAVAAPRRALLGHRLLARNSLRGPGKAFCPERRVRDMADTSNGPFRTLNVPNGPFMPSPPSRTGRSRHPASTE